MTTVSNKKKAALPPQEVAVAPDGGYGWVVLASCFFISFIVDGCMYSMSLIWTEVQATYQVDEDTVNLMPSLYSGFLFCSGPIVSGLVAEFGARSVVMAGSTITAFVLVATALSPNIYFMMVVYGVIGGVSTGMTYIPSLMVIADYFDKKKGMATGIVMAGSGFGSFFFPAIMTKLIIIYDWKITVIVLACIILQCMILGSTLRPIRTDSDKSKKAQSVEAMPNFAGSMLSVHTVTLETDENASCFRNFLNKCGQILGDMFNVSLLWKNGAFFFIVMSALFVFCGYFVPYLYVTRRGAELLFTKSKIASLLSIIGIVNIPARLVVGILADIKFTSAINLNTYCSILTTAAILTYFLMNTYVTQIVFCVLFAIGLGGMNVLATPYLIEAVGIEQYGKAMGILNLFRGIGCFIGPVLGGLVSKNFGGSLAAFWYAGGAFAIGTVFSGIVGFGAMCKLFKKPEYEIPREQPMVNMS